MVVRELIVGDFGGDDPAIGPPWLSLTRGSTTLSRDGGEKVL